ncbi:hypothetical protein GCM10022223_18090 [Kineosporia mesophila]|uniref:Alkaline shock response membrane anchor protein AmaP n=1 Tax=Kineosporia mesophila TaxID=566012 RepID=A0ABP6ZF24_9ACTN|nr:hypothetical protein [Kineosporia mesophila]MCD5351954.1 hypothetical protein [Kineosporia mesophila]
MSRLTITVDRCVAFLLALILIFGGIVTTVWGVDRVDPFTGALDLGPVAEATDKSWWPWAVGGTGAVLLLLALRWLFSHLPRRGIGPLKLAGTGRAGRLLADGNSVAQAAAVALKGVPGVRSAHGRVLRERGQTVARLDASIDADADLAGIAEGADIVSSQLRHVLGRDDLVCQVQLRLAARDQTRARVH